jgi:hypothetical protein
MIKLSTPRALALVALLFSFSSLYAQVVNIPDSNFKAALVANASINTNHDGEIQTSEAAAFTGTMRVSNKDISDLTGIEAFTQLTVLWCDNNNLTGINLSANTELTTLRCNHNQLTSLDVSHNLKLKDLRCYVNQIEDLDVSANEDLLVLLCFQNKLTELNLGLNENLRELQCSFNVITALDVSGNHALTSLDARKNKLVMLNVKNGHNNNFTTFNITNNPELFCVQVDDATYSEANWTNTDPRVFFSTDCSGATNDIVNIPDANFKAALVNNSQINRNNDNEIQVGEASVYNGTINVSSKNISDLTGIEAFSALRGLECASNPLTTLDVSHNTALTSLRCDHSSLTSLVLGTNANLHDLRCYYNQLASLDVSGATGLRTLWCFGNNLTSLDVSASLNMDDLRCNHNQLTSLVLGDHTRISTLYAYSNKLTSLNVGGALQLTDLRFNLNKVTSINLAASTNLTYLNCGDNLLTALSLSNNTALRNLWVHNNRLTSLDLRGNPQLTEFYASKNPLTALTLRTGNNQLITYFNTTNTPQLLCIEVDDPAWSASHWTLVDSHSSFNTNCGWSTEEVVRIPDPNFKAALVANISINTNHDGEIQVSEASAYTGQIVVSSKNIVDLTGIEAFTKVSILNCGDNQISSLYLDHNLALTQLDASYNNINVIWFGSLPNLGSVDLNHNQIRSVDLRELPELWFLDINENQLTSLNMSGNPKLQYVGCAINQITSLDLSTNHALRGVGAYQNRLTNLNLKNGNNHNMDYPSAKQNQDLLCIQVDDPAYSEANWRDHVDPQATFSLDCGSSDVVYIPDPLFKQRVLNDNAVNTNGDGEIQVSEAKSFTGFLNLDACGMADQTGLEAFTAIRSLDVQHNNLTHLDVSANVALQYIDCGQNQITSLKINPGLQTLYGYYNLITSLDLNGNNSLVYFDMTDNKLASVDLSSLSSTVSVLSFDQNPITSVDVHAMTNLSVLGVGVTKLTSIDVSANTHLTQLAAAGNPELLTINAKNGNNTNMELDATNSPKLRCVQVDDVDYAEANFYIDNTAGFSTDCNPGGEVVYIPDPNLKSALLSFPDVNTNHDNEIQVSEAQAYNDYMPLDGKGITDPTGLEAFTAITYLAINNNSLTSLDVRPNTGLTGLDCSYNQITSLHWAPNLGQLSCTNNQLGSLDLASTPGIPLVFASFNPLGSLDLSHNTGLTQLGCNDCGLSSLDVSHNTALGFLQINDNQLTSLNVSSNPDLEWLEFNNNKVTDIDLTANSKLYLLYCVGNQLTELDLHGKTELVEFRSSFNRLTTLHVGTAPNISSFSCDNNLLTDLDISGAPLISFFECQNNRLVSLNLKNQQGREQYAYNGKNNPDLHCIEVSDVAFAQEYWTGFFDPGVTFTTDCDGSDAVVRIPDANFKAALVGNTSINTNGDTEIQESEASAYSGQINVGSMNIADLTGIEAFTAITILTVGDNQLTSLYLDQNQALTQLDASYNNLNVVWFGAQPALRSVDLNHNRIRSVDIRQCPELSFLDINENELTSLNVSSNLKLDYLGCAINQLTSIDVSGNTILRGISCAQNQLTNLNVKNGNNVNMISFYAKQNSGLTCIQVDDAAWAESHWRSQVDAQATFRTDCGSSGVVYIPDPLFKQRVLNDNAINTNGDGEIQVSEAESFNGFLNLDACGMSDPTGLEAFTAITGLDIEHNNLTDLDISANVALKSVDCGTNKLTHVKINQGLEAFACYYNVITSVDLNGNNTLWYFDATDNKLPSLDVSSLGASMRILALDKNPITSIDVSAMPSLEMLAAGGTKLTTIDLSANHALQTLAASANPDLLTINVHNGNNTNMELNATDSPNLGCVEVDDVAYAQSHFYVDATATFSTDCSGSAGGRMTVSVYPNPTTDKVVIESNRPVDRVHIFDATGGRLLATQQGNSVDFTSFQKGVYIINVQHGETVTPVRVVKE